MGFAADADLADHWSTTENVAWKTDIAGKGWSSPVVWGNKVFLTTCINHGESEEPKKGLYFGGDRPKPPESEHEWKTICLDLAPAASSGNRPRTRASRPWAATSRIATPRKRP